MFGLASIILLPIVFIFFVIVFKNGSYSGKITLIVFTLLILISIFIWFKLNNNLCPEQDLLDKTNLIRYARFGSDECIRKKVLYDFSMISICFSYSIIILNGIKALTKNRKRFNKYI